MIHRPITIKQANAFVAAHHRHNKPTQGGRFALAAEHDGKIIGVCIVGRTTARLLHDDTTAEVTRLCVAPDAPANACSFLYGAAKRAWQAMGGKRIVTYTLDKESGASLRGAGWVETATHKPKGRGWLNREGRENQLVNTETKIRREPRKEVQP